VLSGLRLAFRYSNERGPSLSRVLKRPSRPHPVRSRSTMIDWRETGVGWQAARFEVRRADPHGWDLLVAGVRRSHHDRASSARAAAVQIERARRRRVGVIRRLGTAAALVVVIAVLVAVQLERNPARDAAEVLAAGIDSAYASLQTGTPISAIDPPGLTAASVPLPYGAAPVSMIIGMAGGQCYAFYWNDVRGPVARTLVPGLACEPAAVVTQTGHNVYRLQTPEASDHLPMAGGGFNWEEVLPPEQRIRPWIFPAVILLCGATLSLGVRASRVALDA
jgi:hypothetical protein